MTFRKFVQIGRVVFLNYGRFKGKLAVIVDVIDGNRALIDGPCSGVPRQPFKFSEMYLTKYLLKLQRSQRSKGVREEWEKKQITQRFAASKWQKNIEKHEVRITMTDYDRYKLGRAKQTRNKIIKDAFRRIKKKSMKAKDVRLKAKAAKKATKKKAKTEQ
ncbi:large ribosomal subunit protein eL14-like [Macrobrachium nipponense]|uniref:large ribosomal subunit protein eL14-like n=1 Tax=Macrobrachium nipponense TaxID=159736 RepID=UPI0030C89DFD